MFLLIQGCIIELFAGQGVLDVIFGEGASRIHTGDALPNIAGVRHSALTLLRQESSKGSLTTERFRAALGEAYLRRWWGKMRLR